MRADRRVRWISMVLMCAASAVRAQDFRVETDVFAPGAKEPAAEFLTIFYGNTIYDFRLSEPREITVFDMARGRFILLDVARKMKTEITTSEIDAFNQELRRRAGDRDQAFFQPDLTYSFDEEEGRHDLTSDKLTYRAKGIRPKYAEAVDRYRVFADAYAQISAVRPGNLPPYGRLQLNKVLAEHGEIPEDIERTVTVANIFPPKKITARTHHLANWILSEQDQRRIREAGDQIAEFNSVTIDQYLGVPAVASK